MEKYYKIVLSITLLLFSCSVIFGQKNQNLSVTGAIVSPAPMKYPGGTGVASFIFDATNGATLAPNEEIKVFVCSSKIHFTGPPTGSGASFFTWVVDSFVPNCYVGTRTTNISQLSGGVISFPYTVTGSSTASNPGNGINVNLVPHSRDPSGDTDDDTFTLTYTYDPCSLTTATVSGGGTACTGSTVAVNVALAGAQPWSITYTNGVTPTTVTGITTSPYVINASTSGTYSVTSVTDANCAAGGTSSGTASVTISPNPTISTIASNCTGAILNSVTVSATIGSGTLEYSSNGGTTYQASNVFTTLTSGTSYNFVVRGATTLCSVSQAYTPECICSVVSTNTIAAPQSICSGATPSALTGTPATVTPSTAFTYQWQSRSPAGSGAYADISGATSQNYTPGALTATTEYIRLVKLAGCPDTVSASVIITVIPKVTLSGFASTTCEPNVMQYRVNFTVIGTGPFTATGTGAPGTWVGSTWTSGLISATSNYNVNIQDANRCNTLNVNGSAPVCPVTDLTPTIFMLPNGGISSPTPIRIIVAINELNNVATDGTIIVTVLKVGQFGFAPITSYKANATSIGGVSVQNSDWTFTETASVLVFTKTSVISANGVSKFGIIINFDPGNSRGRVGFNATIFSGSGGDTNTVNNMDYDTVQYVLP